MDQIIYSFTASRWTRGNRMLPARIEITPQRVTCVRPRLFGSDEQTIALSKVASVYIHNGIFWSDVRIHSTGGGDPILIHGYSKLDAERIREAIQNFQQETPEIR